MSYALFGFITGMGRSGTQSVARLLGLAKLHAHHEFIGGRSFWLLSWYLGKEYSAPYLRRSLLGLESSAEELGNKASAPIGAFVDVNPYLQACVPVLREVFQPTEVFHLVRDPRRVIPSILVRRDDTALNVMPKDETSIEWWLDATPFERVCWNWQNATAHLLAEETRLLRLEDLSDDFSYVADNLMDVLGGELSREDWESWRLSRPNRTRSRLYRAAYSAYRGRGVSQPPTEDYESWPPSKVRKFEDICGEVMTRVGYI